MMMSSKLGIYVCCSTNRLYVALYTSSCLKWLDIDSPGAEPRICVKGFLTVKPACFGHQIGIACIKGIDGQKRLSILTDLTAGKTSSNASRHGRSSRHSPIYPQEAVAISLHVVSHRHAGWWLADLFVSPAQIQGPAPSTIPSNRTSCEIPGCLRPIDVQLELYSLIYLSSRVATSSQWIYVETMALMRRGSTPPVGQVLTT